MKLPIAGLLAYVAACAVRLASAQASDLMLPKSIEAGAAFSVQTAGSGKGVLYIIGPGDVLKRDIQIGETAFFNPGAIFTAGRYMVILAGATTNQARELNVLPARAPADLSFLARPSRLPVGLHDGITGAVYVFDAYRNLILAPVPVTFQLSTPSGTPQAQTVTARNGAAWVAMDSTSQQGRDTFIARIGAISSTRVIGQVPGDPCGLKMNARLSGTNVEVETDPVRDCSGNAVPDGTVVTFTESYPGGQSTVDVPIKRGIAKVEMPEHRGATISVASGVVLGNQIRWDK